MRFISILLSLSLLLFTAGWAGAQETADRAGTRETADRDRTRAGTQETADQDRTRAGTQETAEQDGGRIGTGSQRAGAEPGRTRTLDVLSILTLPDAAQEAREAGVAEEDVQIILQEADRRALPPAETEFILQEGSRAARENGPVDNFGAFVQSRLDEGLRGRDLAAAIQEEHRLRGKGQPPEKAGKGHGEEDEDRSSDGAKGSGKRPENKGGKKK
jgi:hypothetical protein